MDHPKRPGKSRGYINSSSLHEVMQSMVHSVFSMSDSVASGTSESELAPYGVMRYDDNADSKPPSLLAGARCGWAPRRGIAEEPPKNSSI